MEVRLEVYDEYERTTSAKEMTNVMAKFIAYVAKKLPDDVEAKIKELAADEKIH